MGQAVIPSNFKRSYKRSPYDSGVLVSLIHSSQVLNSSIDRYCRNRRLFQFWLIFPNQNYQSRSMEYKFN